MLSGVGDAPYCYWMRIFPVIEPWSVQRYLYTPFLLSFRVHWPDRRVPQFLGSFPGAVVKWTLCLRLPLHFHVTKVAPLRVVLLGLKKLSFTAMDFEAELLAPSPPNAGTASAAAQRSAATKTVALTSGTP